MKKLMITAAIVCAAAISQGAALTWGTGKIYKPTIGGTEDGKVSSTLAKNTVTAYYFELDAAKYASLLVVDDLAAPDYAKTAAKVFGEYATVDGKKFTVDETKVTDSGKLSNNNSSSKTFSDSRTFFTEASDPKTGYAAMILKYSDSASGQDYYIANLASYTFEADNDKTLSTLGVNQFGDTTKPAISYWTAATAAPEPTSGLLLLLGVAGLALKRRRA